MARGRDGVLTRRQQAHRLGGAALTDHRPGHPGPHRPLRGRGHRRVLGVTGPPVTPVAVQVSAPDQHGQRWRVVDGLGGFDAASGTWEFKPQELGRFVRWVLSGSVTPSLGRTTHPYNAAPASATTCSVACGGPPPSPSARRTTTTADARRRPNGPTEPAGRPRTAAPHASSRSSTAGSSGAARASPCRTPKTKRPAARRHRSSGAWSRNGNGSEPGRPLKVRNR